MSAEEFTIWYLKKAAVELVDNEYVSLWLPGCNPFVPASLRVDETAVYLNGKAVPSHSWIAGLWYWLRGFGGTGIGWWLYDRSETIAFEAVEKIIVHKKGKKMTFQVSQSRGDNKVEVHVFTTHPKFAEDVLKAIKKNAPTHLLREISEQLGPT